MEAVEKEASLKVYRVDDSNRLLKDQLEAERRRNENLERTAIDKIRDLERGLQQTTSLSSQLHRMKEESDRQHEARIWDLRERLDYAQTSRRRYVR